MHRLIHGLGLATLVWGLAAWGDSSNPPGPTTIGTPRQFLDFNCFITRLVSFTQGANAGFGQDRIPKVVYGPPVGTGELFGSTDVLSLGDEGEIVVELGDYVVDGEGPDFIVFENPFLIAGNPVNPFAEPGEVSVSEDGINWATFPCEGPFACSVNSYPYGSCAGWHPVYSNILGQPGLPPNGISPFDPKVAGGDAFDLAEVGVRRIKFVRIRDKNRRCSAAPSGGFDLDAIAIIHAENAICSL